MKKSFFKSDLFCYILTVIFAILGCAALWVFAYFFGDELLSDW